MKRIIVSSILSVLSMLAVNVQAKELNCSHEGVNSHISINSNTLVDDMERVIAEEVSTGKFESNDAFGKVTYTIHGNRIIMQAMNITKEYNCDL